MIINYKDVKRKWYKRAYINISNKKKDTKFERVYSKLRSWK